MKSAQYYAEQNLFPYLEQITFSAGETANVILRPVCEENDLAKVRDLLKRDFGLLPDLYRLATTSADIIVAEHKRDVVGMAIFMKLRAHDSFPALISVPWVSVEMRHRRCGIGTVLVRYIKRVAQRCGIHRIDAARNPCQRDRFLSREGFKSWKRSPAYHDGYFMTWNSVENHGPLLARAKYVPLDILRGDIRIRPATDSDKSVWKMLVLQACDLKVDHDVMSSTFSADFRMVAERTSDGQIIGIVAANVEWVIMLGCEPNSRNAGVGSILLFCALDWSSSHSLMNAGSGSLAHVSLTPLTTRAQKYYEKWGFIEEKGAKKDGYVTMRLDFNQGEALPQGLGYKSIVSLFTDAAGARESASKRSRSEV